MTHTFSLEISKAGLIYYLEPWRGTVALGTRIILTFDDAIGVVVQARLDGEHLRFATGYAEDDE